MNNLRPVNLNEFKGKPEIKQNLRVFLDASLKTKQPLDHVLLYGLPGTGKTSLATIIANELKRRIRIVQGNSIQAKIDIINLAMTLNDNDILFIDEIHAVNPQVVELLYSIMEDFVIDITIGKDYNAKVTRISLPHFTLIGATTIHGKIIQPLEERFGIIFNIKSYNQQEIIEIIQASCNKLDLHLSDHDIKLIANNSKGIPRIANRILRRVHDFKSYDNKLTVKKILKQIGIIHDGLSQDDINYLGILFRSDKPLGIKSISQIINIDPYTIETKIEPYLLTCEYIVKTATGRLISALGKKFIRNINTN